MSETAEESGNRMYRHGSVVRLTMDDPANDNLTEGTILVIEGPCEDGVAHTVLSEDEEAFVDVTCEVIETFEADSRMTRDNIIDWATQQAKKAGVP